MVPSSITLGVSIDIQYEVFMKKAHSQLVWYSGSIIALELQDGKKIKMCVKFQKTECFNECIECFILDSNEHLRQCGRVFPFRLSEKVSSSLNENLDSNPIDNSVVLGTARRGHVREAESSPERKRGKILTLEDVHNSVGTTQGPLRNARYSPRKKTTQTLATKSVIISSEHFERSPSQENDPTTPFPHARLRSIERRLCTLEESSPRKS